MYAICRYAACSGLERWRERTLHRVLPGKSDYWVIHFVGVKGGPWILYCAMQATWHCS